MASEKLYGNTLRKYPYFTFVITRLIHVDCHFKVECEAGRVLTEKRKEAWRQKWEWLAYSEGTRWKSPLTKDQPGSTNW